MICIPDPLKERVWGRGRLLTLPLAVLGSVAAVTVWKIWGVVALVIAALLGLVAELWRAWCTEHSDLERLRGELTESTGMVARLQGQLSAEKDDAAQSSARSRELEQRVATLEHEVEAPNLSLGHLLHAVGAHLTEIELVERQRQLGDEVGESEWAVTSISRDGHESLRVTAHVPNGAGRLGGEPVCLIDKDLGLAVANSIVTTTAQVSVTVDFVLDDFDDDGVQRVTRPDEPPDNYLVRLAATGTGPFAAMHPDELRNYATQLRTLAGTLATILAPKGSGKREDSR